MTAVAQFNRMFSAHCRPIVYGGDAIAWRYRLRAANVDFATARPDFVRFPRFITVRSAILHDRRRAGRYC